MLMTSRFSDAVTGEVASDLLKQGRPTMAMDSLKVQTLIEVKHHVTDQMGATE